MNRAVFLFLIGIGWQFGHAAEPLVKFPIGDAAWSVAVSPSDSQAPSPAPALALRYTNVIVTRIGGLRRDVVQWEGGVSTETWWNLNPELVMCQDARINEIVAMSPEDAGPQMRLDESVFRWIAPENLAGEESKDSHPCFVYRGVLKTGSEGEGLKLRVWIDKTTLLPVALDDGLANYQFTFLNPPAEPLLLPPEFNARLERFRDFLKPPVPPKKRAGRD